ncbi:MAG TPA: carbohydrate porin [Anaeromyxobacteraceae bacterium]|nr:carbohydrate porin [Anaeromyxobacteraceae bacterium]
MGIRYSMMVAATAALLAASNASAFEFHGYFRDGPGWNSKGGGQVCFAMPGSEFKARLGNECEHYYEFSLSEQIYKDQNGVEAKVEWMPAYGLPTTTPAGSGGNFGFGTGNVYTQQIWGGIKLPGGTTVWAGQRYFRRHNVEGLDWFYWNPYQGNAAAGVEDIDLGFGKLALSIGRVDALTVGTTPVDVTRGTYMRPEARIYGIPLVANGTLELGVDVDIAYDQGSALGAGRTGTSPWFTAEYFQDKLLGGWNKLTFQYASGAAAGMNTGVVGGANSDPKQWRIVEQLVFLLGNDVSGQLALVYQDSSNFLIGGLASTAAGGATGEHIFSAELRPSYHFNDYFKFQLDGLYQTVSFKDSTASSANMFKLTAAPTLVTGRGFFARPEIRAYVTYATWNDSAQTLAAGNIASGAFGSDKNGLSFGVQMETWF